MDDLISRLPDDRAINALVVELKKKTQQEAQQFILDLLRSDLGCVRLSALKISKKMIRDRSALLLILDIGLERKDVSEIKFWIVAVADSLGYKRLTKRLEVVASERPLQIVRAWYQLVPLVMDCAPGCLPTLLKVCSIVDSQVKVMPKETRDYWGLVKLAVPLEGCN